jgi:hypothetical protein
MSTSDRTGRDGTIAVPSQILPILRETAAREVEAARDDLHAGSGGDAGLRRALDAQRALGCPDEVAAEHVVFLTAEAAAWEARPDGADLLVARAELVKALMTCNRAAAAGRDDLDPSAGGSAAGTIDLSRSERESLRRVAAETLAGTAVALRDNITLQNDLAAAAETFRRMRPVSELLDTVGWHPDDEPRPLPALSATAVLLTEWHIELRQAIDFLDLTPEQHRADLDDCAALEQVATRIEATR